MPGHRARAPVRAVTAFVTLAVGLSVYAQVGAKIAADAERLVKALGIDAGQNIGEIGAGDGQLTIAIATIVGDRGRVYSNELAVSSLDKIRAAALTAGLHNVTAVEGTATSTSFPDACCDAIVMRDVYHHFSDPSRMSASVLRALKPGGRLGIIEFTPPPGGENPPGHRAEDNHHGITSPTLERELKAAGFELVSSTEIAWRTFMVVARRPAS